MVIYLWEAKILIAIAITAAYMYYKVTHTHLKREFIVSSCRGLIFTLQNDECIKCAITVFPVLTANLGFSIFLIKQSHIKHKLFKEFRAHCV